MAKPPPETVTYFADIFENFGPIDIARFFSGWSFRHMGVQFAVYIAGELYFVVNDGLREKLKDKGSHPFSYMKGGKKIMVERFYSAPDELLENPEDLLPYVEEAFRVAPRK